MALCSYAILRTLGMQLCVVIEAIPYHESRRYCCLQTRPCRTLKDAVLFPFSISLCISLHSAKPP
uniref:Secreted protein n=1 Tax=Anguilla anguilla TaxID=7936 RepID=A0A0E9XIP4_ANGAN